jgi:hypothetical protein
VEQKLALVTAGKWADPRPEYERSPSPEPVYDGSGARVNTRDARQRETLTKQRTVRGLRRHVVIVAAGAGSEDG